MLTCSDCNRRTTVGTASGPATARVCPHCGGQLRRTSPREAARLAMGSDTPRDLHTVLRRRLLGHGG